MTIQKMTIQTAKPDYRGAYHFSPQQNWMNDPNGMVFFDGEYHLFFQHHPFGDTWGPMHWGHAVSRNLIDWEELPIALEPDGQGTIFSGSAVVDWHNTTGFFPDGPGLVAIFTHHLEAPGIPVTQTQSLAYSADRGRTWTKYAGNPVLAREGWPDFRDPKVFWHETSGRWIMVLACGQTVSFYHSLDLKSWRHGSDFGEGIGSHEGVWECPDLFEMATDGNPGRTRWVLLVSIGDGGKDPEGSRTQYFVGGFDGETFVPDEASNEVRWLDHGRDNYAGVSWSDIPAEDGRRLYIGWMNNWRYAILTPTDGWRGAMTLPRELTLETVRGVDTLKQRPAREIQAARVPVLELENATLGEVREALKPLRLESFELEAQAAGGQSFGFRLREGERCGTSVGFDADSGELYLDRSESGDSGFHDHFAGRHAVEIEAETVASGTADPADGAGGYGDATTGLAKTSGRSAGAEKTATVREKIGVDDRREEGEAGQALLDTRLRIFVDRSSVEVFENGGLAITDLIFPDSEADRLSVFAADESLTFASVRIWRIEPCGAVGSAESGGIAAASAKPKSSEEA
ncbi:glycoside hydrolase family 32 protein [Saccharibacillus sacchari]|uniref:Glycoside hydrolase family 32 protein n=1 Tax=Saccharibacillus sacchari TaxID=456493 RepID=A0ACC6PHF6_9BACL